MVVLSRCELARGDLAAAQRALAEAVPALKLGIPGWVASEVVSQQVAVALAQGDEAAAAVALQQAGVTAALPVTYATEVLHLARLALLVHSPHPDLPAAEALANELLASAEPVGRMAVVLQVLLLRAEVLAAQDRQGQAVQDIERVLEIAEPEGYVRVFVNEGMVLLPLLRATHTHRAYAARVVTAIASAERHTPAGAAAAPAAAPENLVEPLTTRELEVLRLIAAGLTYQEIADRQVVSLNTVRFHVKSIYGKLGVDKRFAAITRATALGLL
jgi:LuxR family maltose regulon positive regulatory protein